MIFLVETQLLLVALREEVDRVSQLKPRSLESMFNGTIHIDDAAYPSPYSMSSSTIAIKNLATTASAVPVSGARLVNPAIDGVELDKFIIRRRHSSEFRGLSESDVSLKLKLSLFNSIFAQEINIIQQEALTVAWKCAYWITILLNWNGNRFYLDSSKRHHMSLMGAKNLLLELTYSIAHRVQELISRLCHITVKSLNNTDQYNPVVVCCALWVVFAATHKFERYNFDARSLENLVRTSWSQNPVLKRFVVFTNTMFRGSF